jgi:hypothetical protein
MERRVSCHRWSCSALLCLLAAAQAPAVAGAGDTTALAAAAVQHGALTADPARAGIWKAVIPPQGTMHGEFGDNDPVGMANGARVPSDCSLNWKDPDYGRLYCFSSATSLVFFLDAPRRFLARAQEHWRRLSAAR